jgi:hypothetical protein
LWGESLVLRPRATPVRQAEGTVAALRPDPGATVQGASEFGAFFSNLQRPGRQAAEASTGALAAVPAREPVTNAVRMAMLSSNLDKTPMARPVRCTCGLQLGDTRRTSRGRYDCLTPPAICGAGKRSRSTMHGVNGRFLYLKFFFKFIWNTKFHIF